jgi:hypothetical protein
MSVNKKNRSLWGSRSEAQRIYYQRQTIKRLEKENNQLKEQIIKLKLSNKYKNILYDLKEWLEEEMNKNFLIKGTDYIESSFARVLSKIDELEGGKND